MSASISLTKLKSLAAKMGCEIEDDKDNTTLYVHALNNKAWEEGALSSLVHPYGSCGSYLPAWRAEAIAEAYHRLIEEGVPSYDFTGDD